MSNAIGNVTTGATTGMALGGPVGAGIGAGAGLLLTGAEYLYNKNQAKKDEANRPKYNIPPEVAAGLNEAERQALQGLPDAQKQQYITNLQRGTAYGLSQIGSRKGGLAGLAALNEQQNQGYATLMSADAQARMQNQKQLFGQLQNVADHKQQAFQINQLNPYYEGIARRNANTGAMFQNLSKTAQLGAYAAGSANQAGAAQVGQAPIGTQSGIDAAGNSYSVAPGANPVNPNANPNIPNAFPQGSMLGSAPVSTENVFSGYQYNPSPYLPTQQYGG